MRIRNSPLGFAIAAGVLALSCYFFPDREHYSRNEQEQTKQSSQQYVQPTTQPISETQPATNSEYITPMK